MSELRDWRNLVERRETLQRAGEALADGQLVAFPVDTGYGVAACALSCQAVRRLAQWKEGRPAELSLLLPSPAALVDWAPELGPMGRRLSRRCWPGPVELVVERPAKMGLAARLDPEVRRLVAPDGAFAARIPAHEAIRQTAMLLPGCLVFCDIGVRCGQELLTTDERNARNGDRLALVVADDAGMSDKPASVVRLLDGGWQLLREGAFSVAALEECSARMIVFVCTGNTCRSPLAEALCKKQLAERMSCDIADLPRRGIVAMSAGLSAAVGCPAAEGAVAIAKAYGADLQSHATRPATGALLKQADYVFAMTQSHLRAITGQMPGTAARIKLLSAQGDDIPDPIGGDEEVYRQCAVKIWQCLETRLSEIV
jgi:protein-tyrosine phosphatase